jgi:hypothetical protein
VTVAVLTPGARPLAVNGIVTVSNGSSVSGSRERSIVQSPRESMMSSRIRRSSDRERNETDVVRAESQVESTIDPTIRPDGRSYPAGKRKASYVL